MSEDASTLFDLNVAERVATLTINRPERLNALTAAMVDELYLICRRIERNSDIDVVILTGQGRAFCAGGDINDWSGESAADFARHWVRNGHDAFDALARLSQPVIAVLNGHALGGGLELAACADYRIAEAHVKIGQPEPGLGIIPGWSGTQRAVRRFGSSAVRAMSLFGEVYDAQQALDKGIIDAVAETGEGMAKAQAMAQTVVGRSRVSTELSKMLINAAEGEEQERVLEAIAGQIAGGSDELVEGMSAFKEKRKSAFPLKSKKDD